MFFLRLVVPSLPQYASGLPHPIRSQVPGVVILEKQCVEKTYPQFWDDQAPPCFPLSCDVLSNSLISCLSPPPPPPDRVAVAPVGYNLTPP